ncbi:glycerate kinase type-2 family protein [Pseudooctadecabacter jejudonensis]|uniref:Putative hydroxypyruvate reductase n=1 Tax=Pseudooctadecabacter jejudonensis TaxID=1391910 RepID=A0A1Y5SSF9_9RHOB|nr:glycerate kinase [Pseudooctadecabacter jejudonensis]SLN45450.1 Putative hydroxypyruvate reductase [Pseudooctadecabacter jejudonensis]
MAKLNDPNAFLRSLFDVAVAAADPMACVPAALGARPSGRVVVLGAGKASARMAEALEDAWGPQEGFVITRYGYARPCKGIEIVEAAHPVPDQAGVEATARLLDIARGLGADDTCIMLISGGGSALLCAPADGLSLDDKQKLAADMLASGMPIGDINGIRKELSAVKGGRLAAAVHPAKLVCLMISDVPGDDPGDIASGPTVGHAGDADLAARTLANWNVTPPPAIEAFLRAGGAPVAADDPRLAGVENHIIAAPAQSLAAAARMAEDHGVEVRLLGDDLEGEARDLAAAQAAQAIAVAQERLPHAVVLLSGGECTVTRRGDGIGGPNAEFTLAAAVALRGHPNIYVLACDTDGVDGAAEVAGAVAGPDTLALAEAMGISAEAQLNENNAHGFFERIGAQVVPGPTLTNVNDFRAILVMP